MDNASIHSDDSNSSVSSASVVSITDKRSNTRRSISVLSVRKDDEGRVTVGDHNFVKHSYKSFTWCDVCRDFIWGLQKQGWRCEVCGMNTHTRCVDHAASSPCSARPKLSKGDVVIVGNHRFKSKTYGSAHWCGSCSNFIWGFTNQGWRCEFCETDVHWKCVRDVTLSCPPTDEERKKAKERYESVAVESINSLNIKSLIGSTAIEFRNHQFECVTYSHPTWCSQCKGVLWGIVAQGWKCKDCKMDCHAKCVLNIDIDCSEHKEIKDKINQKDILYVGSHIFQIKTFLNGTWCFHCDNFIWGFHHQGWQCTKCHLTAHSRCVTNLNAVCLGSNSFLNVGETNFTLKSIPKRFISTAVEDKYLKDTPGWIIENEAFSAGFQEIFPSFAPAGTGSFAVENAEVITNWYRLYFVDKKHEIFLTNTKATVSFVLTVIKEIDGADELFDWSTKTLKRTPLRHQYRAIIWLPVGKEQLVIPVDETEVLTVEKVIEYVHSPLLSEKANIRRLDPKSKSFLNLSLHLLEFEDEQCRYDFRFSAFYRKLDQTLISEILHTPLSESFEQFMSFLGSKITLKDYNGYAGNLDTERNLSGETAYAAHFCSNNIIFHVAPLIPLKTKGTLPGEIGHMIEAQNMPQTLNQDYLLDRRQLPGNDIVAFIFQEEDESMADAVPFQPSFIPNSERTHVYIVVTKIKSRDGSLQYRVGIFSNENMPAYGPYLPNPSVFLLNTPAGIEKFRSFLLAKAINGEKAAYLSPTLQNRRTESMSQMLQQARIDISDKAKYGAGYKLEMVPHKLEATADTLISNPLFQTGDVLPSPEDIHRFLSNHRRESLRS